MIPELSPSGGYENIVTAMDVFSKNLFFYPTSSQDAKTIAKVKINNMTRHAYLPTIITSDKGSAFMSQVIKEVAEVLGIRRQHSITKHAQTIGMLKRTHASLKKTLEVGTGERWSMWHKYVNITLLNYNTSYHKSIRCEPSRVFHGRVPYNVLNLKMRIHPRSISTPNAQIAEDVLKQTKWFSTMSARTPCKLKSKTKHILIKKAKASKLKEQQNVYVLKLKADHQGSKIPFTDFRWIGPYIVEKT